MTGGAGGRGAVRRWRLVRAHPDAVPAATRRFMRRGRRRRLRNALPWMVALAVLAMAGVGAWIGYGTAVFGVREVRITGTDLLSPLQVRQAVGITDGTPLLRVDLDQVRRRVAALAPVRDVVVSRDWPHVIAVAVTERVAVAVVPQGPRFTLVDRTGVGYASLADRPAHLPLVRLARPGPDDPDTRAALQVLAVLTAELRDQLTAVVVAGPARIRLELRHERQVIWGDATESDTKAKVATALLTREGDIIDVSAPDVVSIR